MLTAAVKASAGGQGEVDSWAHDPSVPGDDDQDPSQPLRHPTSNGGASQD
jgi:hypothetical protein